MGSRNAVGLGRPEEHGAVEAGSSAVAERSGFAGPRSERGLGGPSRAPHVNQGRTFWFMRKKLVGSYVRLSATRRS